VVGAGTMSADEMPSADAAELSDLGGSNCLFVAPLMHVEEIIRDYEVPP